MKFTIIILSLIISSGCISKSRCYEVGNNMELSRVQYLGPAEGENESLCIGSNNGRMEIFRVYDRLKK